MTTGIFSLFAGKEHHSNKETMYSTPDSLGLTPDDLVMSDTVDVTFELINPD